MLGLLVDGLVRVLAPPCCASCDTPLAREAVFCAPCLATLLPAPRLPQGTTASFAYGGALADAIRTAKYEGRVDRLRQLSHAIAHRLPRASEVDVVAPVPLHVSRLRARGFDQSAVLARAVGRALDKPVEHELLTRRVATPQLALLDAEGRARAVGGAFVARRLAGERVLLVDDVRTTGATLNAAFAAVEAGGGKALAHVLAATPRT